jgi:hypothetical protein
MTSNDPTDTFVLQQFRLRAPDRNGEAASIVASFATGEASVPLLTSIDDQRDVATVRAVRPGESPDLTAGQHAALDPLVESWAQQVEYGPRIMARTVGVPSYFRLAVTGSGINDGQERPSPAPAVRPTGAVPARLGMLWIGVPLETHAGLLVLVGDETHDHAAAQPGDWPLPFSDPLGVRIYDSRS